MFLIYIIYFWYVWVGFLLLSLLIYTLVCKFKKQKPILFWKSFILLSVFGFYLMITYELRIYWYPSEWVTSSSDSLIRYNPLSIAIGYILILILYVFMICVILGKVQLPKWTSVILLLLIIAIFLKNSYCFVINYVGNQYYEFYFPEKKYFIGIQLDDNRTTISELPEEWVYSKINKIELKNGLLTFYRPNRKNYKISESFLFWKLDFGRFDKEIAARKGKYEPSFVANSKGVLMKVGGIAKSNSLYQSFSLPCSCV